MKYYFHPLGYFCGSNNETQNTMIMEKNLTLSANSLYADSTVKTSVAIFGNIMRLIAAIVSVINVPADALTYYYSRVLGRDLNRRQTWLLVNAQLAFFATAFSSAGLLMRLVLCVWLMQSLIACRRAL